MQFVLAVTAGAITYALLLWIAAPLGGDGPADLLFMGRLAAVVIVGAVAYGVWDWLEP